MLLLCSWHRQLPRFGMGVTCVFCVNGPPSPDALRRVLSPPQEATKYLPYQEEARSPGRGVCVCARPRQQVCSGNKERMWRGQRLEHELALIPGDRDGQDRPGRRGKGSERAFRRLGLSGQAGLHEKVTTTGDMLCWRLAGRGVGFVLGPEKLSSPEGSAGRQDGCRWPGRLGERPVPEDAWLPTLCVLASSAAWGLSPWRKCPGRPS